MNFRRLFPGFLMLAGLAPAAAFAAEPLPPAADLAAPAEIVTVGAPPLDAALLADIRAFNAVHGAYFRDWDALSGGMLIGWQTGATPQLFFVPRPGAEPQPLTDHHNPVRRGFMNVGPDKRSLLYFKDHEGDERYQLILADHQGRSPRQLTPDFSRNANAQVSHNGFSAAYTRSYESQAATALWGVLLTDLRPPYQTRPLFREPGAWLVLDWSPDDSKLLLTNFTDVTQSTLYLADVETGVKIPIDARAAPTAYSDARFSADGKGVFFTSNAGGDFLRLFYYDLATGRARLLTGDIDWDIGRLAVSPDGRHVAFMVNENGAFKLRVREIESGKTVLAPDLPKGAIGAIAYDASGRRIGFSLNGALAGPNAYSLDTETGEVTRWTDALAGHALAGRLREPALVHYPSFDQVEGGRRRIPAFYYRPDGPGPHPVVIHIHGGPEAQYVPRFSTLFQYWVDRMGVAVIAPNVRGSTGYGARYTQLDDGKKREDAVKDIGALLDWIAAQPELDESRVLVEGASYGGYMTLAALTHYNDRLRGGIDIVGISNFVSFLRNTGDHRRDLRRGEYGDERDPDMARFLQSVSPLNKAAAITRPLLVAQGLQDPRVPASESARLVETVRGQGGEVWYILAENEGHGFARQDNADYLHAAMTAFIRHVFQSPP